MKSQSYFTPKPMSLGTGTQPLVSIQSIMSEYHPVYTGAIVFGQSGPTNATS